MTVRIECFGRIRAMRDGNPVRLSPQALLLLAILEVEKRPVSRARLIDLIWESDPSRERRHSLSQLLYEIRREAGHHSIVGNRRGVQLVGSSSDYGELIAASNLAKVAATLEAGDFLSDACLDHNTFADWRAAKIAQFQRHVLSVGHEAIDEARSNYDWTTISRLARILLRCDVYDECAWKARIEAFVADGAISRAIGEIASVRMLYRNDLGQALPPLLQRVAERIAEAQGAPTLSETWSSDLPFVSREQELLTVGNALEASRLKASPQLILISGAPGVGKTRLIDRAVRGELLAGSACVLLQCEERSRLDAFNCVRHLVRCSAGVFADLASEWRELATSLAERTILSVPWHQVEVKPSVLNELCYQIIRARINSGAGMVVVIDDVQWVDQASVAAFEYAMRKIGSGRLAWILASRPDGLPISNRIAATWRQAQVSPPHELLLPTLSADVVINLVTGLREKETAWAAAWPGEALAYSGGNPQLLHMWLTSKRRGETSSFHLFEIDLTQTASAVRAVAQTLALLGGRAGLGVLRDVSATESSAFDLALRDLRDSGWICTTETSVEFTHDLIREKIARTVSEDASKRIHGRALATLRRTNRQSMAILAHHAFASGDTQSAARYALNAGEQCLALGAGDEAELFLREAIRSADTEVVRGRAIYLLGKHYVAADRIREAKQCFDQIEPSAAACEERELRFYCRYLGLRAELQALSEDASKLVAQSLDLLRDISSNGHTELLCQAISIAVEAAHDCGQSEVIATAIHDIEHFWPVCRDEDRAFLGGLLSRIYAVYGELRNASVWAERGLEAARVSDSDLAIVRGLLGYATTTMVSGHIADSVSAFEDALDVSRSPECFHYRQRILNNYGVALIEADRLHDARDVFREALTAATGHDRLFLTGNLAYTELLLGRADVAVRHSQALVGLNSVFSAAWVEMFANAIQAIAKGYAPVVAPLPLVVDERIFAMHEVVVHQVLDSMFRVDRDAAAAASRTLVLRMRGRDFLRRARVRALQLRHAEAESTSAGRLRRLSQWARRRGAHRLAAEIEQHLMECRPH